MIPGEYVIKGELNDTLSGADCGPSCDLPLGDLSLPLPEFLLDDLQLDGLDDNLQEVKYNPKNPPRKAVATRNQDSLAGFVVSIGRL